jgi:hypothetical protein
MMSVKEIFDKWYNDLSSNDKKEILSYILEDYTSLKYTTEGYHAGPSGKIRMILDGIHAGPSGSSKLMSASASADKKCSCCGK